MYAPLAGKLATGLGDVKTETHHATKTNISAQINTRIQRNDRAKTDNLFGTTNRNFIDSKGKFFRDGIILLAGSMSMESHSKPARIPG